MRFKRSQLLSVGIVVGYLLPNKRNKIKKIKIRRKQSTHRDSYLISQTTLVEQGVKGLVTKPKLPKPAEPKKHAFTIQQIFDMYEQSYHDPIYLEAVKFLLEQILWQSETSSES